MKGRLFTLPNVVSLGNLACGCAATLAAAAGDVKQAFWLVVAAAAFDFLDGLVARLTGQYSDVGKELDSLCDVVSFGVAPSMAMSVACAGAAGDSLVDALNTYAPFAIALFSALRLARFNVSEPSNDFTGLPTPACALLVMSVAYMDLAFAPWMPALFVAALCALLICPLRMFSLKFKGLAWRVNGVRYCFLAAAAGLVAIFGIAGVAAAVALHVAVSAVCALTAQGKGQAA